MEINSNYFNNQSFKFEVETCPTLSEFIQTIGIPSINLGETPHDTALIQRKEPGDRLTYGTINISFIVNEDLQNWFEIYEWFTGLGFPDNFQQHSRFKNRHFLAESGVGNLTSTAFLLLYDNNQQPVMKIYFYDVFPISLSEITLTTTDTMTNNVACIVDFQFTNLSVEKLNNII
jgi:hypothetical protein